MIIRDFHTQIITETKKSLAFGCKIDSLEISTANEKWEKCTIDRTDPANKKLPIRKSIDLKRFCIYFSPACDIDKIKLIKDDYILKPSISYNNTSGSNFAPNK